MNESRSQRTLLVEILIAVLFFALCATVLLRTFVSARECSRRAGVDSVALLEAQDLAERLYASEDQEALLAEDSFAESDGVWLRDAGDYRLEVCLSAEEVPAGELMSATIRALRDDDTIVEIPSLRYVPREAIA